VNESQDKQVEVHQVGPHVLELEKPDIVHIHYDGDVELEHFLVFDELIARFTPPTGVYLLRDRRRGGFVTRATREYVGQKANISHILIAITYGASFQTRTAFQMMSKGATRIRGISNSAVFVETEEEGRTWIAMHRESANDENSTNG
jgi:hypothetical protein